MEKNENIIYKNKAKCQKCQDIIESTHRHDFVMCKCSSIFIDGGPCCWRQGGEGIERIYERII